MAIQNDNTLVTKGDLKELYTDKIAPYLGGGISYYYTDRTGEELLNLYAGLSTDSPETDSTKVWTATLGAKVPFVKISGSFIMPSPGVITIPAGTRVELAVSLADDTANTNTVFGWYNDDTNQPLEGIKDTLPWTAGGALYTGTTISQWTNSSNEAVNISYRVKILNTASKIRYRYSHLSVQEISRIVDPVKYVSNNSDLQETPVGNIISYMGNTVPKHYLPCDGATYSVGSYPELEQFIIDEFGSINYFGGDGSTTWAVPDLRGEFLRGTGTNSHTNQGNGANVGEHQDATQIPDLYMTHNATIAPGVATPISNKDSSIGSTSTYRNLGYGTAATSTIDVNYTARPTNTSVQYCIKYESTYHAFFSNAAYKVSVPFTVPAGTSGWIPATLNATSAIGDTSLISGNYLITPMDGWYAIGCLSSQSGSTGQYYGFAIDDVYKSGRMGYGSTEIFYLTKGQTVKYAAYAGNVAISAQNGYVNFCLITSNYNPTIVSADSVYSENEQMIGYWKDGKPLYQKTVYFGALPNTTTKNVAHGISNLDYVTNIFCVASNSDGSIQASLPYLNATSSANNVSIKINGDKIQIISAADMSAFTKNYVTIQYTKTTDTASTLQVENSLLLNRPDLWTAGTEYSFGGGLYGKRTEVSSFSLAAKGQKTVSVATGASKIVNYGGEVYNITEGWHQVVGTYRNVQPSADNDYSALYYIENGSLDFWFSNDSSSKTLNFSIDAWVLYKK